MIVGSIKENLSLEKRVALTPESAKNIIGLGLKVCIEKGYALHLGINDHEYKSIGVETKASSKASERSAAEMTQKVSPKTGPNEASAQSSKRVFVQHRRVRNSLTTSRN